MDKHQQHMLGLTPEPRTTIDNRIWSGAKLALWRSKYAWDLTVRQAAEIIQRCRHADDCAGKSDERESCLETCPDREIRLSALVVLNAARAFAPPSASKLAQQPYV